MSRSKLRVPIALGLILLLSPLPGRGASPPLGKVVPGLGTSLLNGTEVKRETSLFSGDTLTTQAESVAVLVLARRGQVHLGPASAAAVTVNADELVVHLDRGLTWARSGSDQGVSILARGLLVRAVEAATYEVAIRGNAVLVSSHQGSLEVRGTNRSLVVPKGTAMRFELADNPQEPKGPGAGANLTTGATVAIGILVAAGIAAAIAIPLALSDEGQVSPATP